STAESTATATGPTPRVEHLGTVDITASDATRHGIYAHVPVGGISGIDCDATRCIAVSDDPGQRGPVRAYDLDPVTGQVGAPIVLTDTRGVPYRPGTVDPESIRLAGLDNGTGEDAALVWTSEGIPTLTVADRTGRARKTLPVPENIRENIRRNQGLEGLAVTGTGDSIADTSRIITATEAAPDNHDHPVITVHDGAVTTQYTWPGTGISEILSVPEHPDQLLVLERGYTAGRGNSSVIWRTTLTEGAGTEGSGTEGSGTEGSAPDLLERELAVDLGALIGHTTVGNTEAMAWAPGEPGVLLIATDDNFHDDQRGVLHRIRVRWAGA
ncbi:esterase-like activity of phytase family protein, partial [uncultured Corynebacterium sp.]|uniref:esterase-like activity of phytase family protein n=1 Tax=uncultured Corynebacterium sp. TaxID=159447 RepID=UPI0025D6C259